MEVLKEELDNKKLLFKEKVEKEFKELMNYFKEVIKLKNKFFDYDIRIYRKGLTKIYIENERIGIYIKGREKNPQYKITKNGISYNCYDFWFMCYTYSKIDNYGDFINSIEMKNIKYWNIMKKLKDKLDIKSLLEKYIKKHVKKDIEKIDTYINIKKTDNSLCLKCKAKLPTNAKFCSECGWGIDLTNTKVKLGYYDSNRKVCKQLSQEEQEEMYNYATQLSESTYNKNNNSIVDENGTIQFSSTISNYTDYDIEKDYCIYCEKFKTENCNYERKPFMGNRHVPCLNFIQINIKLQEYIKYRKEYIDLNEYSHNQDIWNIKNLEDKNCMMCKHFKTNTCPSFYQVKDGDVIPAGCFQKKRVNKIYI